MKNFTILAVLVILAYVDAYIVGRDPPTDGLNNFIVTFNTDLNFIRIGQIQSSSKTIDFVKKNENGESENYRLHFHIKKRCLKKIEESIKNKERVFMSTNVKLDDSNMDTIPFSFEVNPESQVEAGSPELYRFNILAPIEFILKWLSEHVSIHGDIDIKIKFAKDIEFDMYVSPPNPNYESHGKISMTDEASHSHESRTERRIGIYESISF